MKRNLKRTLFLVSGVYTLCLHAAGPGFAVEPRRYVLRESFDADRAELEARGWSFPSGGSLERETPGASEGGCLRVSGNRTYANFYVPVEAGNHYMASVRMRTEKVSGRRGAVIFLQWADKDRGHRTGGLYTRGLLGDHSEWVRHEVQISSPPAEVAYLNVTVGVEGEGTAWFDDVQVWVIGDGWKGPEFVRPAQNETVTTRAPVFTWKSTMGYGEDRLELSRDSGFPESATHVILGEPDQEIALPFFLESGPWYYRVTVTPGGSGTPLPLPHPRRLIVAEDAVAWPPSIEPAWEWSDEERPVLRLTHRVFPADEGERGRAGAGRYRVEWSASINGRPAAVVSGGDGVVLVTPTDALAQGVHTLELTATKQGQAPERVEGVFSNKSPSHVVKIDDNRKLMIDDEPFFPLGAYRDPSDTLDCFDGLHEAGFKITHHYGFEEGRYDVEAARRYLDAAHNAGLKVFMGLPRALIRERDFAGIQRWVAELMDHPALLTWYLMDEPDAHEWATPRLLQAVHRTVARADPFHPTSILYCSRAQFEIWARHVESDINWYDPYPVDSSKASSSLFLVEEYIRTGRRASGAARPVWTVLQGFDWVYWHQRRQWRDELPPPTRPSRDETRAMTFLALASGGDGLIWYWIPRTAHCLVEDAPDVWAGIVETTRLIRRLRPWLLAEDSAGEWAMQVPHPFRAWTREAEGERLVAMVNGGNESAVLDLDVRPLLSGPAEGKDFETGESVSLRGGRFRAEFHAHEVRILSIEVK